ERRDGARRGVGSGNIEGLELHGAAIDPSVGVHQADCQANPSVLVDPAGTLRPAQRIDRAHPDGGRRGGARAREHREREDEGNRCHESSNPAPRSTQNAAIPYAGMWTSANRSAVAATAATAPNGTSLPYRKRRKNASSETAASAFNASASGPMWTGILGPAT